MTKGWIERNKGERPFAAGALAYMLGHTDHYGCHFGMRSTQPWCVDQFHAGWEAARKDNR